MRKAIPFSVFVTSLVLGLVPSHVSAQPGGQALAPCQDGWRLARVPNVGHRSVLNDVAAISWHDVWAVGSINDGFGSLAMHFDGSSWSVSPTPTDIFSLTGVTAVSSDDVWAVGWGGPEGVGVAHWDGSVWTSVSTPSPGQYGGQMFDVAAIASNDVWAVGFANTAPTEGNSATLTEHWDGTAWTIVPSPTAFVNSTLRAVSTPSSSDVWALGLAEVDRWNGSTWNLVSSAPPSWKSFFLDVAAFGPKDVWATGYRLAPTEPSFVHWDGAGWTFAPGAPIPLWGEVFGIGGPSTDRLWAVGQQASGVLMERWDGTLWNAVQAPNPPGSTTAILYDVVVDRQGVGWAVGSTANPSGNVLIERTC